MADDTHDTIDKSEKPVVTRRTALSTPLLGIVLGIIGAVVMGYTFVNGVQAALTGSGDGAGLYVYAFFGGAVLTIIAIIIGIVGLVRGGHRFLSFLSLLVGLIPGGLMAAIYVLNAMTVCCALPPTP